MAHLHGRPPSPGARLPEAGGRCGRHGTGQRRELEVGQCPRHRRLPDAPDTANNSTHDWSLLLPSQGESPDWVPTSPLGAWSSAELRITDHSCTGQVFLCKRPETLEFRRASHRHPGAGLPGEGANGVLEAGPDEALAIGDRRLAARLGDRDRRRSPPPPRRRCSGAGRRAGRGRRPRGRAARRGPARRPRRACASPRKPSGSSPSTAQ